jgi:hypothetical protein
VILVMWYPLGKIGFFKFLGRVAVLGDGVPRGQMPLLVPLGRETSGLGAGVTPLPWAVLGNWRGCSP